MNKKKDYIKELVRQYMVSAEVNSRVDWCSSGTTTETSETNGFTLTPSQ